MTQKRAWLRILHELYYFADQCADRIHDGIHDCATREACWQLVKKEIGNPNLTPQQDRILCASWFSMIAFCSHL